MENLEKGIARVLRGSLGLKRIESEAIDNLLHYLDSQGLVRKVESEFPQFQSRLTERANLGLLVKQGWSKTERLIDAKAKPNSSTR